MSTVLLLGSGPNVTEARLWPQAPFDRIVAINNAWRVRPDWEALVHPWDFPPDRRPVPGPGQRLVTQDDFVPVQNGYGGFVYAGGTMAFTAAYWALATFRPRQIAVLGCDMHYPAGRPTHFYGTGTPDPLRADITLQSLEAKSARLMIHAARQGCAMVNLSAGPSRQVFPRAGRLGLKARVPLPFDPVLAARADRMEADLGYVVPSGRYWEEAGRFDAAALRHLDALWLAAARPALALSA
ncbi:MAG: hypothetical protein V4516_14475 [Pseudomonadota bacterium]